MTGQTTQSYALSGPNLVEFPPFLQRPVRLLLDRMRHVAQGTELTEPVAHALMPPGKLVRPLMLLATIEAVGGDPVAAVPAAVGVECCHVASLVHDDIIDCDATRRGRATVHKTYGQDTAIVAGDALLFESLAWGGDCITAGVSSRLVAQALNAFANAGKRLCAGQALEGVMVGRGCSLETYQEMVSGKTGALIELACFVGAALGEAPAETVQRFADFGATFGTAFQMQDDLLPYGSDSALAGKDRLSDIRNGRPSLPYVLALAAADLQERAFLENAQRDAAQGRMIDAERVAEALGAPGVVRSAEALIDQKLAVARDLLAPFTHTQGGAFLQALLEGSVCRLH